jgi:NarL family two-component system response regulator LiaR
MPEPITVLVVDDHQMICLGIQAYFDTLPDIQVVGQAASGAAALALVEQHAPDVVLMDLIMPEMDGVEATRRVKQVSPRTQVIVLTSYHDDEHIFPAIRAGALSYLLKDIDPDEMAEAVRRAHAGEAVIHPRVAARLVQELHGARQSELVNPFTALTARELDVLRLVAGGKSNQEIAEQLVISEKTVKSHVSNILRKLHLADRTQAAVFAWREGVVRKEK